MASFDKLTFGSYEVLQNPDGSPCILGQGGFGVTYKARHTVLERISALKVIREDLLNRSSGQDQEETKRFLREARAVGRLNHLGIASVFDCALDNGVFYYAMEFCDGGTLKDWCRENGPMPWHELRVIAYQIASALDCAHKNGLIHRDIKPSNIMLSGEGKLRCAKLIDFGLAQDLSADSDCSVSASGWKQVNFGGNLATASPEQILGKKINPQSDLFSLGVTLWWLLLGRSPFRGITRGMIVSDRISTTSYASSLPKDIDPEARVLLEALLEKDVEKRIPSARAVMTLLNENQSSCSDFIPVTSHEPLQQPCDFEEAYRLEGMLSAASQAKLYNSIDLIKRVPVIAVLPYQSMEPCALGGMRIASQRRMDFSAYAFLDWRYSGGGDVFVLSKPEGCNLLAILRKLGPARLEEALPLLSHLAYSFDASIAWTTFGIRLDPGEILVKTPEGGANIESFQSWRDINPTSISCLPQFTPEPSLPSSSVTTRLSLADFSPLAQFAALIHQVLVGSAVRYAAFFTTDGYVKSHRLSEGGNSLLAAMLCNSEADVSATDFLMMLADAESVILCGHPPVIDFPTPSEIERGKLPPTSPDLNPVPHGTRGPAREDLKPQSPADLDAQPNKSFAADVENARIQSDAYERARMEFERLRVLEVIRRKDEAKVRRMAEREARYREIAQRADVDAEKIRLAEEQSRMVENLELELARKKQESLEIEAKLARARLAIAGKQPQGSAQHAAAPAIPTLASAPVAAVSPQAPSVTESKMPVFSARVKLIALAAVLGVAATAAVMMIPHKGDSKKNHGNNDGNGKQQVVPNDGNNGNDPLKKQQAEKERQAMLDAVKIMEERQAKLAAEKAEKERLAKLAAEKVEKERLAKLAAEKAEIYPVTIRRSATSLPGGYRYHSFRVEEIGANNRRFDQVQAGKFIGANLGSQWKIVIFDEKGSDLATAEFAVPKAQAGHPLAIELPASLPLLRVENPYKNSDYASVKITFSSEGVGTRLSVTSDQTSLKIGARDFSLAIVPREQTLPFPVKDKVLVMPFAGTGQWTITYTGSRLPDKTEKPPVSNQEPMSDIVLKTPPPFSGHYSIIAPMTPYPVEDDMKPVVQKPKVVGDAELPEIDYFNELYYTSTELTEKWKKNTFFKRLNKSYGLPHFLAASMRLDLKDRQSPDAGKMIVIYTLPEGWFAQVSGSLDIKSEVRRDSGKVEHPSLLVVMQGDQFGAIDPSNPTISGWIRKYTNYMDAGDSGILDKYLNNSLAAWVTHQNLVLSGKTPEKDDFGLNFDRWKMSKLNTLFRFELVASDDGVILVRKALQVIGKEDMANGYDRKYDGPVPLGVVLLKEDSSNPGRIMLPFP